MTPLRLSFSSLLPVLLLLFSCGRPAARTTETVNGDSSGKTKTVSGYELMTGADRTEQYLPLLRGKGVAVVANQTSLCGDRHIVDVLVAAKIDVKRVFAPEHGFRGEAGAGDHVRDGKDPRTGIQVVSLYGKKLKPDPQDLEGVDVIVFDIQDVGVRFYTYISTLQYVMEAAADRDIDFIVLDRPDPNGHYVDGPVLDTAYRSFVGMNPVPVVHGCTVGEYARMLAGESWLKSARPCRLKVITMLNYSHRLPAAIDSRPSPNLRNMNAILLYPSLCFFEGTRVSLGRGTEYPFECFGFPEFTAGDFSFTPRTIPGVAVNPPFMDTLCHGSDLRNSYDLAGGRYPSRLELKWLLQAYAAYPDKDRFFTPFFSKLAGTAELQRQIKKGLSEEEIRKSWEKGLRDYKAVRSKYLLYPDFE
jgi:uncharacterized protein YbbC (DUF1343 family)